MVTLPPDIIAAAQTSHKKWRPPASVTLARWGLESGWGAHLSGKNNPFGIKALPGRASSSMATSEYEHGVRVDVSAAFADFETIAEAFDELLATAARFAPAAKLVDKPKAYAEAMGPVYATAPSYAATLIAIMDRENLYRYDAAASVPTLAPSAPKAVVASNIAPSLYAVVGNVLCRAGKPVPQMPSPNHGGIITPAILVMHYTAGVGKDGAINTLRSAAAKVSAHLVLDRDGSVYQLLPLNVTGWHVGASAYHGRQMCNGFSIGIEMVNAGYLQGKPGSFSARIGGTHIPDSDVLQRTAHPVTKGMGDWQKFTPAQIQASIDIGTAILRAYPTISDVVGHENVAPSRKIDPGPAYPLLDARRRMMTAAGRPIGPFALDATPARFVPLAAA